VAVSAEDELRIIARERLNFLAIGFYVRGGIMVAFSCFFLLYVCMFLGFSFIPEAAWNQPPKASPPPTSLTFVTPTPASRRHPANSGAPPVIVFRIMAGVMGAFVLVGWAVGALTLYAGRCIQKRRHKVLIYIMAAVNCVFIPYGILLGIFTFIILGSTEAREEFRRTT
jgi:hypothetical protein